MVVKVQLRRDLAVNWTANDPILLHGEVGLETDTNKLKMGDGANVWSALAYLTAAAGAGGGTQYVQYNNAGAIAGDSQFTYNFTTNTLRISGAISGAAISGGSIRGNWIGSPLTSSYITGYMASNNATGRFYPSSLGKGYIPFSSNSRMMFYPSSLGKSLYDWSSNALKLYGASSHIHDSRYYTETEIDNNFYTKTWINTLSGSIDGRIDAIEADTFDHELYIASSAGISRFADSSNYAYHSSNRDIHYPSSQLLGWLNALYQESGTSATSDVAWSGAYQFYSVSSLAKRAYESGQRVKDLFDHTLYAASGIGGTDAAWSGALGFYIVSSLALKSGVAEINTLSDVDTKSTSPTRDQVLKWNGTNWVPAAYGATFVYTIASFSDGETTTQLIGTGTWKAQSAMSYTATYNNGPPTTTWVSIGYNSTNYSKSGTVGEMTGPSYTAGTNDVKAISYPAVKDQYLRFILSSQAGTDTDTETESSIYFRNYIYYGKLTKNKSITESDIETLTGTLTNTGAGTFSINASAGEYLVLSYPATYTNIPSGSVYETDGGTGFLFNSISCAFSGHAYISVTNSAGYTENYKVYASNLPNLGNHSLVTTTSVASTNYIYYGVTETLSGYSEADIEALGTSVTSNTKGRTITPTVGATEYVLYCLPVRLGTVTFTVNGFTGGFQNPETVAVTNANGWLENYYVYRSTNKNLGSPTIVVV
ncbi:MAG: hypothetical protein IMZ52_02890 [Actinobacteria bacterium]|nr:hypothetical protein [Actinomycetota bacterium]MBE3114892.1 hypothetical protein [Actinomycetota bacterium]